MSLDAKEFRAWYQPVDVPKPTPPDGGWQSEEVDGLPLRAWVGWTLQSAGCPIEDPTCALFLECAMDPEFSEYLKHTLQRAVRHYADVVRLTHALAAPEPRSEP